MLTSWQLLRFEKILISKETAKWPSFVYTTFSGACYVGSERFIKYHRISNVGSKLIEGLLINRTYISSRWFLSSWHNVYNFEKLSARTCDFGKYYSVLIGMYQDGRRKSLEPPFIIIWGGGVWVLLQAPSKRAKTTRFLKLNYRSFDLKRTTLPKLFLRYREFLLGRPILSNPSPFAVWLPHVALLFNFWVSLEEFESFWFVVIHHGMRGVEVEAIWISKC